MSFAISVLLLVGARLWLHVWKTIADPERERILNARRSEGKNVLVIGGAGYIGSALLPKLLADGYRVRLLDLLLYDTEPIDQVLGHPNLEVVQGDFRHVGKIVEVMQGIDSVVHLGAIVGDPACELDRELTTEVNLSATRMVAEVAKLCKVRRFVFASTCSVYGACDEVLDERSQTKPVSHYGNTKLAAERVLNEMSDANFEPTSSPILDDLRVFGPNAVRSGCEFAHRQGEDRGCDHRQRWQPVAAVCTRRRCRIGGCPGAAIAAGDCRPADIQCRLRRAESHNQRDWRNGASARSGRDAHRQRARYRSSQLQSQLCKDR